MLEKDSPSAEEFDTLARMFRTAEQEFGEAALHHVKALGITSNLQAKKIMDALRDESSIPRQRLESAQRRAALQLIKRWSPVGRLISRNTRELLRRYYEQGLVSSHIARQKGRGLLHRALSR
jgi:hypothetical protein